MVCLLDGGLRSSTLLVASLLVLVSDRGHRARVMQLLMLFCRLCTALLVSAGKHVDRVSKLTGLLWRGLLGRRHFLIGCEGVRW